MNESNVQIKGLRMRDDLHLLRKFFHMTAGILGIASFVGLGIDQFYAGLGVFIVGIISLVVELARFRSEKVNSVVLFFIGPVMRESERDSMSGMPFYAFGVGLSLLLFEREVALLSILFLVFADPISSTFGILFGTKKILPNKSLEGFLAGFICCALISALFLLNLEVEFFVLVVFSLIFGFIGSVSELLSIFIDDNLTIPLVSGLGLTLLDYFFHIF